MVRKEATEIAEAKSVAFSLVWTNSSASRPLRAEHAKRVGPADREAHRGFRLGVLGVEIAVLRKGQRATLEPLHAVRAVGLDEPRIGVRQVVIDREVKHSLQGVDVVVRRTRLLFRLQDTLGF